MTNKTSSFAASPIIPLEARHGGKISSLSSELPIHAMGNDYTVDDSGVIISLPVMAAGMSAVLKISSTPTFVNSTNLICQGGVNYVGAPGDYVIARSDGDGIWRLFVIPAILPFANPPQGRITLSAGIAVTTSDVSGAASHIYTPANGNQVPVWNGANMVPVAFSEISQAVSDATKSPYAMPSNAIVDIYFWLDGATPRATRSDYWTNNATATMTIASPAVVSQTAHGMVAGQPVRFTTSGALPTGVVAGTIYYVIGAGLTANAYEFAATVGGSAINTSGSQSGTHTAFAASDTIQGTGAGTPERQLINGIWTNKNAITNGPAANMGTLLGSVRGDASGQLTDSVTLRWVSNAYNAVPRQMKLIEATASWTYNSSTFRVANNNSNNKLDFLQTLAGGQMNAQVIASYSNTSAGLQALVGIDIDTITTTAGTFVNNIAMAQYTPSANQITGQTAIYNGYPGMGRHTAIWKESASASGTYSFYGGANAPSGIYGSILN